MQSTNTDTSRNAHTCRYTTRSTNMRIHHAMQIGGYTRHHAKHKHTDVPCNALTQGYTTRHTDIEVGSALDHKDVVQNFKLFILLLSSTKMCLTRSASSLGQMFLPFLLLQQNGIEKETNLEEQDIISKIFKGYCIEN